MWRKSTYSSGNSACVEVAFVGDAVAVRDSKDQHGPVLVFTPREWDAFIGGVRDGQFRPPASTCVNPLHDLREITVTEATKRGVASLVADAEHRADVVVTRHDRPVAAVIGVHRLIEIDEAAADLRDLALVLARSVTDRGRRTPFDDVLAAFGHTRDSLTTVEDDE